MTEASEESVAALRAEWRKAGRATYWLRIAIRLSIMVALLLVLGRDLLLMRQAADQGKPLDGIQLALLGVPCFFVVAATVAAGTAAIVAGCYRSYCGKALGKKLGGLSPQQRVETLQSLQSEKGDTRQMVEPLLRDFRLASEVTPAAALAGRGDEPAPS